VVYSKKKEFEEFPVVPESALGTFDKQRGIYVKSTFK